MNWLAAILTAVLKFLYDRANDPKILSNAQTPSSVRARWDTWIRERLRDKDSGDRSKG